MQVALFFKTNISTVVFLFLYIVMYYICIIHVMFEIFMSVNEKGKLHEQLRAGPSEFSKTTIKRRHIYYNFQASTPHKIQAFPPNFLVRKFFTNRS